MERGSEQGSDETREGAREPESEMDGWSKQDSLVGPGDHVCHGALEHRLPPSRPTPTAPSSTAPAAGTLQQRV